MMLPHYRISALALSACLLFVLPGTGQAASADPAALEDYLQSRYYEVEFFVFERPDILDFATEEILALDRPRALPNGIRTQRLAAEALWTTPLDPLTRGCLTFPTITYELLPEMLATETLAEEGPLGPDVPVDELTERPAVPLPLIEPRLEPDPQLDLLAQVAAFERELEERSQRWLPSEDLLLQRAANRIERRGLGRILFHGRWLQAVPPRESPDPVLVTGGKPLSAGPSDHELVGSVGVTLGRYLHFNADLFFHGPGLGLAPAEAVMRGTGESLLLPATAPPAKAVYMQLSESRRMRSEELHYLDHPKLGLVVRIDPVTVPETLLEALGALQTIEESTD
jgi:hypothetical protein